MAERMSQEVKEKAIRGWLQGKTRDEIAMETQISSGSASNIIKSWLKGLDSVEYSAARDLAVQSRKCGMNLKEYAEAHRLKNLLKCSGDSSSYEKIEMIITNIKNTCMDLGLPEESLSDILLQVFELSNNESIHPVQVPYYIIKKIQEKKQLEQDIEKLGIQRQQYENETNEALQKRNLTIDVINEHIHLREELEKLGIPLPNVQKTINAINNTCRLGYEPAKIAARFGNTSSLEKEGSDLANRCLLLKQKADGYGHTFILCQQLVQLNIGSDQIESVVRTIIEIAKRNSSNRSVSAATAATATQAATTRFLSIIRKYDAIEELDTARKALAAQIDALRERLEVLDKFWVRKNHVIESLISLYCRGVKDEHILYIHNFFSRYYSKIKLDSLVVDLERYAYLKEAVEELSKKGIIIIEQYDRIKMEISLLQEKKQHIKEKTHAIYLKKIKRKKIIRQLSRKIAKMALAFNLPTAIFSTDTQIHILSNILCQKPGEKEKNAANKMKRYNSDGKAVV
jgi:hypothetical protein